MRTKLDPSYLNSRITHVEYIVRGTLTICVITMQNGFKAIGTSACVDPRAFKKDVGESIAYSNAFDKLWEVEGYLLKEKMYEQEIQARRDIYSLSP